VVQLDLRLGHRRIELRDDGLSPRRTLVLCLTHGGEANILRRVRLLPSLLWLCLAACASAPEKMPFAEAMKSAVAEAPPKASLKSDPRFEAELRAFIEGAQAARKGAVPGSPMPVEQSAAWAKLLADVDGFLSRPAAQMSALDLARARGVLESELEFDAQAYGDIAPDTAAAAQGAVRRLTRRLNELLAMHHRPKVTPRAFSWPVSPVLVTSPFGDRVHPMTGDWRMHKGIDVAAEVGQPVRAAFSGTVLFAGWAGAHGKSIHLWHDSHWTTRYSHLSGWQVGPGDVVQKGQIIGYAGSTGQSTGPHLHFELLHEGEAVDPEEELPQPPPPPTAMPMAAR
jgi:murein DD-endopeptidase MepM/ murein hydrolase activator NlpD